IGGEAREAEEGERDIAFAFGGQKIAVMRAAEARHERQPHLRILFKLRDLLIVDDVTNIAGDHVVSLQWQCARDCFNLNAYIRVRMAASATLSSHSRMRPVNTLACSIASPCPARSNTPKVTRGNFSASFHWSRYPTSLSSRPANTSTGRENGWESASGSTDSA